MDNIDFKNVISAAELVRLGWRAHGWLLWQMVPQGGITLLAGETASGKSFLGLDLALGMASGRGRAWDMEIREPIADSSWLIADRKRWLHNGSADDKNTVETARPGSEADRDPHMGAEEAEAERSAPTQQAARVRYFCSDADPNLIAERVIRLCRGYPNGKKGMGIEVPTALDLDFSAHAFSNPESFDVLFWQY